MTITLNGTTGITLPNGSASTPAETGTDTDSGVFYGTNTVSIATGGTAAVTVDSSQNVGIGTSSPTQKLDVSGTVQSQYNAGTNDAVVGSYNFYNTNSSASSNPIRASIVAGRENSAWGAYLQFNTSTGTSAVAERMRIDSSGNLFLATSSNPYTVSKGIRITPTTLQVAHNTGDYDVCGFYRNGSTGIMHSFWYNSSSSGSAATGGQVGSVSITSSATAYNTSSDYRLKENIAPMTGALAKVQALKPCTYTWKSTGEQGEGFIAHELAEVVPDAVTGEKDAVNEDGSIKPQGIDTSFLVATLTAAIQELKAELDTVKTELATLKGTA
jgi:hypothetical protein